MSDEKFRYYADLRHGTFVFVTRDRDWPPEGYPVIELTLDEVQSMMEEDDFLLEGGVLE